MSKILYNIVCFGGEEVLGRTVSRRGAGGPEHGHFRGD